MNEEPLGLYIHVPFCTVKCSYCDFNSYAGIEDMQSEWETAALTELSLWAPRLRDRKISTVFIGGGTPSLLPGESVAGLLDLIRSEMQLDPDAEVTLEANPESVDPERLEAYRSSGVNRISMGVQSLNSSELVFLDRIHSADRAMQAFGEIRDAGFDNVNLDLIYGLPGQTLETWQTTLEQVLTWVGMAPTISRATRLLSKRARRSRPASHQDASSRPTRILSRRSPTGRPSASLGQGSSNTRPVTTRATASYAVTI